MAISDTITSMYENVGEVYDTITNVTLPEHKNIENIPRTIRDSYLEIMNNGIDVIYDNWEKVTGSGENLSLTPTEEAKMGIIYKGNTYQYSTTGKNLMPKSSYNSESGRQQTFHIDLPINTYTVSFNLDSFELGTNTTMILYMTFCYDEGSLGTNLISIVSSTQLGRYSATITTTKPIVMSTRESNIRISSSAYNNGGKVSVSNIQIETGNIATSYEPYTNGASPNPDYPQDIQVVSGDNTINVTGKNLFDSSLTPTFTPSNTNWYSLDGISNFYNSTNVAKSSCYFDFKAGVTYTISIHSLTNLPNVAVCNSEGTSIISNFNSSATYTPSNDIRGWFRSKPNASSTQTQGIIQIEYGSEATNFEPYQSASYPINLPEGMELCKIGTYQDRIFKNTPNSTYYDSNLEDNVWYLNKQIGKVVLNGSEADTTVSQSKDNSTYFQIASIVTIPTPTNVLAIGKCTYFEAKTSAIYNQDIEGFVYSVSGMLRINILNTRTNISSGETASQKVTKFKTWLGNNNPILYYPLQTPTYTEIEGTLKEQLEAIKTSYENQTNISQENNDLPFILDVSALEKV